MCSGLFAPCKDRGDPRPQLAGANLYLDAKRPPQGGLSSESADLIFVLKDGRASISAGDNNRSAIPKSAPREKTIEVRRRRHNTCESDREKAAADPIAFLTERGRQRSPPGHLFFPEVQADSANHPSMCAAVSFAGRSSRPHRKAVPGQLCLFAQIFRFF